MSRQLMVPWVVVGGLVKSRPSVQVDGSHTTTRLRGTGHVIVVSAYLAVSGFSPPGLWPRPPQRRPTACAAARHPAGLWPTHRHFLVSGGRHYRPVPPRL